MLYLILKAYKNKDDRKWISVGLTIRAPYSLPWFLSQATSHAKGPVDKPFHKPERLIGGYKAF